MNDKDTFDMDRLDHILLKKKKFTTIFEKKIRGCTFYTDFIRLDFDHNDFIIMIIVDNKLVFNDSYQKLAKKYNKETENIKVHIEYCNYCLFLDNISEYVTNNIKIVIKPTKKCELVYGLVSSRFPYIDRNNIRFHE